MIDKTNHPNPIPKVDLSLFPFPPVNRLCVSINTNTSSSSSEVGDATLRLGNNCDVIAASGGGVNEVILSVVDGKVWAPFDDKTLFLDKGTTLVESKHFDAGNGCVRDGQDSPIVAGNACSSGQRQK